MLGLTPYWRSINSRWVRLGLPTVEAVSSVLPMRAMSPVSLVLNRTVNGVTMAGSSRSSGRARARTARVHRPGLGRVGRTGRGLVNGFLRLVASDRNGRGPSAEAAQA